MSELSELDARRTAEAAEAAKHYQKPDRPPLKLGTMLDRMDPSDLIRIKAGGAVIYSGYKFQAPRIYDEEYVRHFGSMLDLYRGDWPIAGTAPPMDAGDLPRYEFKDINIRLYMVFELSV